MNVDILSKDPLTLQTPLLVLPLAEGTDPLDGVLTSADSMVAGAITRARTGGDFSGRTEETLLLYPPEGSGPERLLVVGTGKPKEFDGEILRRVLGRACRVAEGLKVGAFSAWLDPDWTLGSAPTASWAWAM